jgi:mono/diheme cytochrome c family protein
MNPGSFKRYIPPWDSADFDELVKNDQELRQWILTGGIDRFRKNPAARFFLERQVIKMPAYAGELDDGELDAVIAYIEWVRDPNASGGLCAKPWVVEGEAREQSGDLDLIARGAEKYRERGCAACHGAEGKGGVSNRNHRVEKVPALDGLAEKLGLYRASEAAAVIRWLEAGADESRLGALRLANPAMFRESFRRQLEIVERGAKSAKRERDGPAPPMDMPAWVHLRGAGGGDRAELRAIFAYLIDLQDWEGTP